MPASGKSWNPIFLPCPPMAERRPLRDVGTSIRARLLAIAHKSGQQFDLLLTRYAIERLLYRLSVSAYRERFVLGPCWSRPVR